MKTLALLIPLILMMGVFSIAGQEKSQSTSVLEGCQNGRNNTNSGETEFKEIDLGPLRLSIPAELKEVPQTCLDGGCWKYANGQTVLEIDNSDYAYRPTFERKYPSYTEEVVIVDDIKAKFWSFEDHGRFISGAMYGTGKDSKGRLGIYFQSGASDTRALAKQIFASVRFGSRERP